MSLKQSNMNLNKSIKKEPEPEQQSELSRNGVPRDLYHEDGTPDYRKASEYLESMIARIQKTIK